MKNFLTFLKELFPSHSKKEWELNQVTLLVKNIHTMKRFYTQTLGLTILQEFNDEDVLLGHAHGSIPFIRLLSVASSKEDTMNLTYYLGFELPKRSLLGDLSNHLLLEGETIVATNDDGYSEAFYIMDPEQNRLKFYVEKKHQLLEEVNHEGHYLEGTQLEIPIEHFLSMGDTGIHGLPAQTRLSQVHYVVENIEQTIAFFQTIFPFKTTYDYVVGRKNVQINHHYYSLAVNEWQKIESERTLLGVREILFLVPTIKELEQMVERLEEAQLPYLYQDLELKIVTPDHIRFHFKVGERL